jgi:hypothetical protein
MIFTVNYTVYPFDLMIFVNEPYKNIKKTLKKRLPIDFETKKRIKELKGEFEARTVMFPGRQTCIVFKSTKHNVIVHEVFHAVEFLFRSIDIPLTLESGEAYAYLIGYITDEIYKKIGNEN